MGVDFELVSLRHRVSLDIGRSPGWWIKAGIFENRENRVKGRFDNLEVWDRFLDRGEQLFLFGQDVDYRNWTNLIVPADIEAAQCHIASSWEERPDSRIPYGKTEPAPHTDPEVVLAGTAWPFKGIYQWLKDFKDKYVFIHSDGDRLFEFVARWNPSFKWRHFSIHDVLEGDMKGYVEKPVVPLKGART